MTQDATSSLDRVRGTIDLLLETQNGVVIVNRSDSEDLVMLKHFGPGNPQAPIGRA